MNALKQIATVLKGNVKSRFYLTFAIVLIVLNAADALLTLYDITIFDGVYELNPIMALVYNKGPVWFFSVKYYSVAFGTVLMLAHIQNKKARYGLLGGCALYFAVVVYHVAAELYFG